MTFRISLTSCTIPSQLRINLICSSLTRFRLRFNLLEERIIDRPALVHRAVRLPLDHLCLLYHWGTRALRIGTLFLGLLIARALDHLFGTRLGPYPRYEYEGEVIQ